MNVLTLNCHSWIEENPQGKLQQLVDKIVREDFDVIALQEVNQRIGGEAAVLDEWYCLNNETRPILADNFAFVLAQALQIVDQEYYWTWGFSHYAYDHFEEGLAILSKEPLLTTVSLVSDYQDINDSRRRILISGVTEKAGKLYTVGSVHHSWWQEGAFKSEWEKAEEVLSESKYPIILAGDFNQIAGTIGYNHILNSPLQLKDSFEIAEVTIGEATIEGPIDGWNDYEGQFRIDYIFVSEGLKVQQHEVIFDGVKEPLVSDHFGVVMKLVEA